LNGVSEETFILMGVCGCGKTTVGTLLAARVGGVYLDGDDFHPAGNKAKMAAGQALDDADRAGWLAALRRAIDAHAGPWPLFLGCSALKRRYRDLLRGGERGAGVRFVYLRGSRELLAGRLAERQGHYMKAGMLESQLADLEEPAADERAVTVDIAPPAAEIVAAICLATGL